MQYGQIPLPFERFDRYDFDSFVSGDNGEAVEHLMRIGAGEEVDNLFLWGQVGTGKSHLLQAVCTMLSSKKGSAAYIPLRQIGDLSPDMLEGLEALDLVCIDDLDRISDNTDWEEAVFHLFNRMRENERSLLMSAVQSPQNLAIKLADLKTRLSWGLVYRIQMLDDDSMVKALKTRARQRMFELPDDVLDYLIKRVARDSHSLFKLLDDIDNASISEKRKITIPFIKDLLSE